MNQSQEAKCYFGAKITKNPKMSEEMSAFAAYKSVEKKRIVEEPKKKKNRNRKNRNKVNWSSTLKNFSFKKFFGCKLSVRFFSLRPPPSCLTTLCLHDDCVTFSWEFRIKQEEILFFFPSYLSLFGTSWIFSKSPHFLLMFKKICTIPSYTFMWNSCYIWNSRVDGLVLTTVVLRCHFLG